MPGDSRELFRSTDIKLSYLDPTMTMDSDIMGACLWYFDFYCYDFCTNIASETSYVKAKHVAQYIGVLDIDIDGMTPDNYLLHPSTKIVNECLEKTGLDYNMYFSGNKGFHVYLYDVDKFMVPRKLKKDFNEEKHYFRWALLRAGLGATLVDMVDFSPFKRNCGIRPYTCINPKSGCLPVLYAEVGGRKDIWEILNKPFEFDENLYDEYDRGHSDLPIDDSDDFVQKPKEIERKQTVKEIMCTGRRVTIEDIVREFMSAHPPKGPRNVVTDRWCYFKNREHTGRSCTNYLIHVSGVDQYRLRCLASDCLDCEILFRKKYLPATIIDTTGSFSSTTIDSDYISPTLYEEEGRMKLVLSPMGSGKTTALKHHLLEKYGNANNRVLFVVTRISQARFFEQYYRDCGVTSYLEFGEEADENNRFLFSDPNKQKIIVCINSLVRCTEITSSEVRIPVIDYLVLDEIESIIQSLLSSFLGKSRTGQMSIFKVFVTLMKTAKDVVMMDGLPSENIKRFLSEIKLWDQTKVYINPRTPDYRKYRVFNNLRSFYERFRQSKKKIVFISNAKTITQYFYLQCELEPKLCIVGDSLDTNKITIENPNANWTNLHALFYNTTVGPGASYDIANFEECYVYIDPRLASPIDVYQLICRIRKLVDKSVYMYIKMTDTKPTPIPNESDMIKKNSDLVVNYINLQHMFYDSDNLIVKKILDNKTNTYETKRVNLVGSSSGILQELSWDSRTLVIKYETNTFIQLYSLYEGLSEFNKNHINYIQTFQDLVNRNGAPEFLLTPMNSKEIETKITFQEKDIKEWNDYVKEHYHELDCKVVLAYPADLSTEYRQKLSEKLDLSQHPEEQFTFMRLLHVMSKTIPEVYFTEYFMIGERKRCILTTTRWTLISQNIRNICAYFDESVYVDSTGVLKGGFTNKSVTAGNVNDVMDCCMIIAKELEVDIKKPKASPKMFKAKVTALWQKILRHLGYATKKGVSGKNRTRVYSIDEDVLVIRLALMGLKQENNKWVQTSKTEAFNLLQTHW